MLHPRLAFGYNSRMMNILVLYGGKSGEHEVSLRSAASVVRNLKSSYKIALAGIDKNGLWFLQPEDAVRKARENSDPLEIVTDDSALVSVVPGKGFAAKGKLIEADVVFPVLHGSFGEDGTIQGLLDTAGLPYVGAGVLGSSLSMDKEKTKQVWAAAGLPVVPYVACRKEDFQKKSDELKRILRETEKLGFPVFVKPCSVGSSVGITKVKSRDSLKKALETAFKFDTKALVEQGIDAREIECSVLGNRTPRAFTPGEIVSSHEFYDYEAKYLDPRGAQLLIPAGLDAQQLETIKTLAVRAFEAAAVEGMARVDFFVDRESGTVYLNEINTIPGFTSISMFPKMCEHDGLLYPELLESLLRLGMERHSLRQSITYLYQ